MKKGFATSAILYTMLLLFMLLLVSILNNLQNKKTILDTLKKDTINALQQDTVMDSILDQITMINNKIVELDTRITAHENNTYTKTEIDNTVTTILNQITNITKNMYTKEQVGSLIDIQNIRYLSTELDDPNPNQTKDEILEAEYTRLPNFSCSRMYLSFSVHVSDFGGGVWLLETCRASSNYGTQTAKLYATSGIVYMGRSRDGGNWTSWEYIHGHL